MRKPQYTTDKAYRIISRPGNLWQLQVFTNNKGTKEYDPWVNRSHFVSFDEASALLRSHEPPKKKVA